MRSSFLLLPSLLFLWGDFVFAKEPALIAQEKLVVLKKNLSKNSKVVQAIVKENAKKKSKKLILERDEKWKSSVGMTDLIRPFLENECARELRKIKKEQGYIAEIFVMDNQGAIVCETDRTSDYWQGDEAKWIQAFANGKGSDHIGKPEFDESSQAFLVQVSFPVFESDNQKAIGTVTVGIDLDDVQ